MRTAALTRLAILLGCATAWGQSHSDLTLTLATESGRTQFRRGEVIEVELRFQSNSPGKYQVWTNSRTRTGRTHSYDRFRADPAADTADPLADASVWSAEVQVGPILLAPVGATPATVSLCLNEWISFRRPGKYRITLDSTRAVGLGFPDQKIAIRSSAIEIRIIEPEPGWAAQKLKDAVAVLERPEPPMPRVGQPGPDPRTFTDYQTDGENAARTLRALETPEAAAAMAHLFRSDGSRATSQLAAGLWATPYRKEAIAAMERAVADPDFPVTPYFMGTLMQLKTVVAIGPIGDMPAPEGGSEAVTRWMLEVEAPYRARGKPVEDEVGEMVTDASRTKRGQALAATLQTLAGRGGAAPAPIPVKPR